MLRSVVLEGTWWGVGMGNITGFWRDTRNGAGDDFSFGLGPGPVERGAGGGAGPWVGRGSGDLQQKHKAWPGARLRESPQSRAGLRLNC